MGLLKGRKGASVDGSMPRVAIERHRSSVVLHCRRTAAWSKRTRRCILSVFDFVFPVCIAITMKILFLHGWTSVPGGVKPTFLAQHGHIILNPKLPDDDFAESVRIAQAEFDRHHPQVVVGSSRGGAVAMNIDSGAARLVLLCPAWKKYGASQSAKRGSVILHSRADDVIPFADSEELVRKSGLPASALIEVGSDHRLADPEPLRRMLAACEGDSH